MQARQPIPQNGRFDRLVGKELFGQSQTAFAVRVAASRHAPRVAIRQQDAGACNA